LAYLPGDELIDLESLMQTDTLFSGIKEVKMADNKIRSIAFPNPFNSTVSIKYSLYENVNVSFEFYDITGRIICKYNTGKQAEGINSFNWNGKDDKGNELSAGVYFYRIRAGNQTLENKIIKQ
jgi:flagellar hook assembly protein FlgD